MATTTRVIGPVDRSGTQWTFGRNRPDSSQLAFAAPPGDASLATVLGAINEALGKPASANPTVMPHEELLALTRAWLVAHKVDRIILVHADWLPATTADDLAEFVTELGIDLVYVTAGDVARDPLARRRTDEMRWVELVEDETRCEDRRARLAADPARHQLDALPRIGLPAGIEEVDPWPRSHQARVTELELARLQHDGDFERKIAQTLHLVLKKIPSGDLVEAASGAAAALTVTGWSLHYDPALPDDAASPRWADLRTGIRPVGPAVVALLAAGLWAEDIPGLTTGAVAADGSVVTVDERKCRVPLGARAYLVAQRELVLAPGHHFINDHGRRMTIRAVASTASAVLAEAGVVVEAAQLRRPTTVGLRWLAERGFVLRRRKNAGTPTRVARRCRHGLPPDLLIGDVRLEHSQSLCRDDGPADEKPRRVRPAKRSFTLQRLEDNDLGVRYAVSHEDGPAGQLVGLGAGDDVLWLQVGVGAAPPLEAVQAVLQSRYPGSLDSRY